MTAFVIPEVVSLNLSNEKEIHITIQISNFMDRTGGVWVDPKHDLVYVFLSNRVFPSRDNPKLSRMNIRGNIQDALIKAVEGE